MHLQRILLIVPSVLGVILLGLVIVGLLPWIVDSSAASEMGFLADDGLVKLMIPAKEIAAVCFGLSVLMAFVGGLAKPVGVLSRGVIFVLSLVALAACFLYVIPFSTFLSEQLGGGIHMITELVWPSFWAWVTISSAAVLLLSTLVIGRIGRRDLTVDSVAEPTRSGHQTSGQLKTGLVQFGIVLICAAGLMFALRGKSADEAVGERFESYEGASTTPSEESSEPEGSSETVEEYYYGLHPTGSVVKPSWPAAPPEDAPTIKLNIDELLADFKASPEKTKDRLAGKWVEMTTEVNRLDAFLSDYEDGSHYTRLTLQAKGNFLFCFMRDAQPWTKTSQGSEVTVRGVFGSERKIPHLDHGQIIAGSNSPTKEITIEDLLQEYTTDPEAFRKAYDLPYFTEQIIVKGAFAKKIASDKHLLTGENNERLLIEGSVLSHFRLPQEGRVIKVMGELREDTLDGSDKPEIFLWNVVPVDFFESDSDAEK